MDVELFQKWMMENAGNAFEELAEESANNISIEQCLDSIKEHFDCSICRDPLQKPIQTQCGHVFCTKCLRDLCSKPGATCPLCKTAISNRSLIERDDVGDLMKLVSKLNGVFNVELKKFMNAKDKNKVLDIKKQKTTRSDNEVVVRDEPVVSTTKAVHNKPSEKAEESTKASKSHLLHQMMNQNYAIISTDVIPEEPLDLSLSRSHAEQSVTYRFQESGIRFVKPLDLSKKEKRKFEETLSKSPTRHTTHAKASPPAPRQGIHQRKKGKFEDQTQQKTKEFTAIKGASKEQNMQYFEASDLRVDFENLYDDEDSPIKEYPQVFTPTPPTSFDKGLPAETSLGVELLASETRRDLELPFYNEDAQSSGGKVTSSDEIFAKLSDGGLLRSKDKSQDKQTSQQDKCDSIKNNDAFTFKQPRLSVSQAPKRKPDDEQNKKEKMYMDVDDDFQRPRDSDLLFLDVSMSGIVNTDKKQVEKSDSKSDFNDAKFSRRLSGGSDGEKENGPIPPRSLSRNGKRKASPDKPGFKRAEEEAAAKKSLTKKSNPEIKRKTRTGKETGMFDDDDDEDWLLDEPEPNKKSKSEKPKQALTNPTPAETPKPTAPVTPVQKQRYVFCPTRLTKSQTTKLQQLCRMCDGKITKEFTDDVTHLVINLVNGRVPQTLKYLQAIAGRKWVVIYDWIEKCVDGGELISEEPFETSNFKNCDPGAKRSRMASKLVFEGFKFFFATEIYKSLGFTKVEVSMLMQALGATVVESADSRYRDLIIIGSVNGNSTVYNDWLNTNKWVTVTFDWVIECILEYRLKPFEGKHLCVDASKLKSINAPKSFQAAYSQFLTQKTPRHA